MFASSNQSIYNRSAAGTKGNWAPWIRAKGKPPGLTRISKAKKLNQKPHHRVWANTVKGRNRL